MFKIMGLLIKEIFLSLYRVFISKRRFFCLTFLSSVPTSYKLNSEKDIG